MANRNRDAHIERTKAGIAHFKRRTGISWGRKKRTVTAEHIAKFREAFDKGDAVSKAAKYAGISNAYFYGNREEILSWKPGMAWPMPRGISGDELRAMGIIPLHAKVVGEE